MSPTQKKPGRFVSSRNGARSAAHLAGRTRRVPCGHSRFRVGVEVATNELLHRRRSWQTVYLPTGECRALRSPRFDCFTQSVPSADHLTHLWRYFRNSKERRQATNTIHEVTGQHPQSLIGPAHLMKNQMNWRPWTFAPSLYTFFAEWKKAGLQFRFITSA
jgi:hypothetical protein